MKDIESLVTWRPPILASAHQLPAPWARRHCCYCLPCCTCYSCHTLGSLPSQLPQLLLLSPLLHLLHFGLVATVVAPVYQRRARCIPALQGACTAGGVGVEGNRRRKHPCLNLFSLHQNCQLLSRVALSELQSAKRNPCIVVNVEPPPTLTSPS